MNMTPTGDRQRAGRASFEPLISVLFAFIHLNRLFKMPYTPLESGKKRVCAFLIYGPEAVSNMEELHT